MGTVVCPTLDRMVRESLFETEQKNSSSEEQSQVDIFGKGVRDRGRKNKPQMRRSKCIKMFTKASDQHEIISTIHANKKRKWLYSV